MSRLLPEWLNANYHKSYPFDEATAAKPGALPTTFLLDMQLFAAGPIDKDHTYISRVENDGASVSIYVSSDDTELGLIARVPLDQKPGTDVQVALKNDTVGVIMDGYVTVGLADIGKSIPQAVINLTEDTGKLHPGVVTEVTNWTPGVIVDGVLYSGNVSLVAGAGISFSAQVVNGEPVIYIEASDANMNFGGTINSDEDILNQIREQYGLPIYSINSVQPDNNGNIGIEVKTSDSDVDYAAITLGTGNAVLTINDNRTKPCCTLDDQQIVIDNIAAVNDRAARLESMITSMETNLNSISAQLAIIGNQQ